MCAIFIAINFIELDAISIALEPAFFLVELVNRITNGLSRILERILSREQVTSLVKLHKDIMREWCVILQIKH